MAPLAQGKHIVWDGRLDDVADRSYSEKDLNGDCGIALLSHSTCSRAANANKR